MKNSTIQIADEIIPIVSAEIRFSCYMEEGGMCASIDISVSTIDSSDLFLAINCFPTNGCQSLNDLIGRRFVLDSEDEDGEASEDSVAGGLMESVMGDDLDPLMFHRLALAFSRVDEGQMCIKMSAKVFDSTRQNIPVEGILFVEMDA